MVKFTRRHFEQIAEIIKAMPKGKRKEWAETHAKMYEADNPRFDKAKFMKACGVTK
jgi:hypothetical protein